MTQKKCYTIGYSGLKINEFIDRLKTRNINCVIDVRSSPYSKFVPEYNRENLKKFFKENKIYYLNFDKEFGARRIEEEVYSNEGIVDFNKTINLDIFKKGLDRIQKGLEKYNIVLMCSEKQPKECHRFSMLSKGLKKIGVETIHILEDNSEIKNSTLEKIVVNKFFPNNSQISLFEQIKPYEELLELSYKKLNLEIGYSKFDDEEKEEY